MTERVMYMNQVRGILSDGLPQEWKDTCHGHSEIYAAMHCHDRALAAVNGRLDDSIPPLEGTAVASAGAFLKAAGANLEMRIVKRTYRDEVIDVADMAFRK